MFPEESISSLEVACQTWPVFDVQLTTGQQNRWVGTLARKCSPVSLLSPSFPLPNLRSKQKYYFFLNFLMLREERQSCNTSHYKIQFLEAGSRGRLMNIKEEKGNLLGWGVVRSNFPKIER